jgi:hypothetical protein
MKAIFLTKDEQIMGIRDIPNPTETYKIPIVKSPTVQIIDDGRHDGLYMLFEMLDYGRQYVIYELKDIR